MHWVSLLVFVISANVDNFTVGIAYGIRKIQFGCLSNLIIAGVTAAGTFLSMTIGTGIERVLPGAVANAAGSLMLVGIGLWILGSWFREGERRRKRENRLGRVMRDPESADRDHSGIITARESLPLALALTVNNFGLGVGASITGLAPAAATAGAFVCSLLAIAAGSRLGAGRLAGRTGRYATMISGLLILGMGVYELVA